MAQMNSIKIEKTEKAVGQGKRRVFMQAGAKRAWLLVVTNGGKEGLVIPQLIKHDMEVYRPMTHKLVVHARQQQIKATPVYPRHLFVRGHDDDPAYARISGMLGVAWIYPRMLLDSCIQRHKREEKNGFIDLIETLDPEKRRIKEGDRITTLDGLIDVIVSDRIDDNRVAALSQFMNGNSRLTVDISKLAA